jgi:hypothetical protein
VFSGGAVNRQTKAEKNKATHERQKANYIKYRDGKSKEPFRCPWCPGKHWFRSADVLQHMFVNLILLKPSSLTKYERRENCHTFTTVLGKTRTRKLRQARPDDLAKMLQEISIS